MKKTYKWMVVLIIVIFIWSIYSREKAKQEVLSHTGAGHFEIKNVKLKIYNKKILWKVSISDITLENKPTEYSVYVNYLTNEIME